MHLEDDVIFGSEKYLEGVGWKLSDRDLRIKVSAAFVCFPFSTNLHHFHWMLLSPLKCSLLYSLHSFSSCISTSSHAKRNGVNVSTYRYTVFKLNFIFFFNFSFLQISAVDWRMKLQIFRVIFRSYQFQSFECNWIQQRRI